MATRGERTVHSYGSMARKIALHLDRSEFTQLFELLDHDSGEQFRDAITAIEVKRRPEHFTSPREWAGEVSRVAPRGPLARTLRRIGASS